MAIELGFSLLDNYFNQTTVLGIKYFIGLMITCLTCLAITRDVQKWRTLFGAASMGWYIAGIPVSILQIILGSVAFVLETLSLQAITQLIGAMGATRRMQERKIMEKAQKSVSLFKSKQRIMEKEGVGYDPKSRRKVIIGDKK